ncbi:hypothetical protein M011DRAFT_529927 [Sporormia fimetaria CBS 119925]|uniref:Uncharacterized protein n=1 Tax=Sporormia fimetaria CBS 119925 TaxID=1340428 RepID=A0A6A6UXN2_9PLEO|nr:hypothetical protein M011DRAFT_529927 [Sporormia fimetaria CBS 119925]
MIYTLLTAVGSMHTSSPFTNNHPHQNIQTSKEPIMSDSPFPYPDGYNGVDQELIKQHKAINSGYVAGFIPFIVIAFILGLLFSYFAGRQRTLRWLNGKCGAYFHEKARHREDRIELEERKAARVAEHLRRGSAPGGAAWV